METDLTFQDLQDRGFQFVVHCGLASSVRNLLKHSTGTGQPLTPVWEAHKVLLDNMIVFNDSFFTEMFLDPKYSQLEDVDDYPVDKILLKRYFRRNFYLAKDRFFAAARCFTFSMLNLDKTVKVFENLQSTGIAQYWLILEQEINKKMRKDTARWRFSPGLDKGVIAEPEFISETELQGVKLNDSVIKGALRLCISGFALSLCTLVVCECGKKLLHFSKRGV
ncbi:unnamed protein product [Allacma fusca]|uniref:Uncharacterized protein n=1 Tax=Allacma fusca TaxID=39272 RepID=A0A8J2K3Y8_9HEXA|nr:unnamed protein product [Allacma fusca]